MSNKKLDNYEQKLEDSLDFSSITKGNLSEQDKLDWAEAAIRHKELQKSKHITLSVGIGELLRFKTKAKEKGIPYQTLMNVIIKQYNDDKISVEL